MAPPGEHLGSLKEMDEGRRRSGVYHLKIVGPVDHIEKCKAQGEEVPAHQLLLSQTKEVSTSPLQPSIQALDVMRVPV